MSPAELRDDPEPLVGDVQQASGEQHTDPAVTPALVKEAVRVGGEQAGDDKPGKDDDLDADHEQFGAAHEFAADQMSNT